MQLGMIGLGRMGGAMADRLRRHGHDVVGFDRDPRRSDVADLAELVARLAPPRTAWIMVPAGEPTRQAIHRLGELLDAGDTVVDGGNSHYVDDQAHAAHLAAAGVGFVDVGVSGGVWGDKEGYAIMAGGDDATVARLRPIFDALRPPGAAGFVHAGPVGAGHYAKMVHNGIEYGVMQALGEGYALLAAAPELVRDVPGTLASWREGTVIRSWLLDLLVRALEEEPGLAAIRGVVADSGEGRWTVQTAVERGVPAPVISAALFARFASRQDDSPALKVVAALRNQFGGHPVTATAAADQAGMDAPGADVEPPPLR